MRYVRRRFCAGFTLVEVIVAVAITGIIVAVIYGSLRGIANTVEDARLGMELNQSARCLLWRMGEEIGSAFISNEHGFKSYDKESGDYEGVSISFSSALKGLGVGSGSISRIEYYYRRGTLFNSVDGNTYSVIEGVDDFSLRYFSGMKWVKNWDSELKLKLPDMVEINLVLGGELFSLSVAVPVTKRLEK